MFYLCSLICYSIRLFIFSGFPAFVTVIWPCSLVHMPGLWSLLPSDMNGLCVHVCVCACMCVWMEVFQFGKPQIGWRTVTPNWPHFPFLEATHFPLHSASTSKNNHTNPKSSSCLESGCKNMRLHWRNIKLVLQEDILRLSLMLKI